MSPDAMEERARWFFALGCVTLAGSVVLLAPAVGHHVHSFVAAMIEAFCSGPFSPLRPF